MKGPERLQAWRRAAWTAGFAAALGWGLAPLVAAQAVDTGGTARRDSTPLPRPDPTRATPAGAPSSAVDTMQAAAAAAAAAPAPDTGGAASAADSGADSALQRVRSLIAQGQTSAARALVDSLLATAPRTSDAYASILYTRATLATSADSAEDDYRRVIVEYPASPRVADALLRLAQLELARGDRQQATAHLDRLTREQLPNQTGIGFARTELQVGLAYFDLQDTTQACAALVAAHTAAPTTDVELRNRIDYNTQRCPSPAPAPAVASSGPTDTTRHAGAASGSTSARTDTAATKPRARAKGQSSAVSAQSAGASGGATGSRTGATGYTIQIAAYQTHAAAAALVERLRTRGYVARIYGAAAPYRVRVGRFATETQADSAARSLKRKGITGFVTPGEPTS